MMKNGIKMTPDFIRSFLKLTGTFKPKHPPQNDKADSPAPPPAPAPVATNQVTSPATNDDPVGEGGLITPYTVPQK